MAAQIFSAIIVIIVGVGGCVAYFWGANKLLDLVFPSRGVSGAMRLSTICGGRALSGPGCSSGPR